MLRRRLRPQARPAGAQPSLGRVRVDRLLRAPAAGCLAPRCACREACAGHLRAGLWLWPVPLSIPVCYLCYVLGTAILPWLLMLGTIVVDICNQPRALRPAAASRWL